MEPFGIAGWPEENETEPAKRKAAARVARNEKHARVNVMRGRRKETNRETVQPRQVAILRNIKKQESTLVATTKLLKIQRLRRSFHRADSIMRRL